MKKDLKEVKIGEEEWYDETRKSRAGWWAMCRLGIEEITEAQKSRKQTEAAVRDVVCDRLFHRESDKKRHKCLDEKRKPVSKRSGAVQCDVCRKWFRSRGGLASPHLQTYKRPNCYDLLPIRACVTVKRQQHNKGGTTPPWGVR